MAVLFGLKIAWNIFTPVVLTRRALSAATNETSGISMAPLVEIALLLILLIFSAISSGEAWFNHPAKILLWGIVAIVGSYVLCGVLIHVLGKLVSLRKKSQFK